MRIDEIDLDALYQKATLAFAETIQNEGDIFLAEIGVPATSVTTKNEWVRVEFTENKKDRYMIEIRLTVQADNGEKLGYYCLHVDETGTAIDDYLVFE